MPLGNPVLLGVPGPEQPFGHHLHDQPDHLECHHTRPGSGRSQNDKSQLLHDTEQRKSTLTCQRPQIHRIGKLDTQPNGGKSVERARRTDKRARELEQQRPICRPEPPGTADGQWATAHKPGVKRQSSQWPSHPPLSEIRWSGLPFLPLSFSRAPTLIVFCFQLSDLVCAHTGIATQKGDEATAAARTDGLSKCAAEGARMAWRGASRVHVCLPLCLMRN